MSKTNSELCLECLECCKVVVVPAPNVAPLWLYEEWAAIRNVKIVKVDKDVVWMTLPYPCPHLTDKGCAIYDVRPTVCRIYNPKRDDPALSDICKWEDD